MLSRNLTESREYLSAEERLLDAVRFYRPLGFFSNRAEFSDEDLAVALQAEHDTHLVNLMGLIPSPLVGPEPLAPERADWSIGQPAECHPEITLLSMDKSRVWWEDLEQDFYPGTNDFVRLLGSWSEISRGAFQPSEIREIWNPGEVMYLEFGLNGRRWKLIPWAHMPDPSGGGYGWTDTRMLNHFNKLIASTGFAFYSHESFDQSGYVLVLSPAEYEKIVQERGWPLLEDNT